MPELTLAQQAARRLDATSIVGATLWGEARNEPTEGILAVGNVIGNRARDQRQRFGRTWQDVCLRKWQFSCWIPEGGARNYDKMVDLVGALISDSRHIPRDPRFKECWWVARGIIDELLRDNTCGANHYHTQALTPVPAWGDPAKIVARIGAHIFYRL